MVVCLISKEHVGIQHNISDYCGKPIYREFDLRTKEGIRGYEEYFGCTPNERGTNYRPRPKRKGKRKDRSPELLEKGRFLARVFNERDRRLFAGFLAELFGHRGVKNAAELTSLTEGTVRRGKRELDGRSVPPDGRIRCEGGGRPTKAEEEPQYEQELEGLIEDDMAGDPMTGKKWVRKTLRWMEKALEKTGISTCIGTIRKTLKEFGISLKQNVKKESHRRHPDRDRQFLFLNKFKRMAMGFTIPIISVDLKKKENIGNFKNKGRTYRKEPIEVLDHDFPSLGKGKLLPYGIYDLRNNEGHVYCGTSLDTSEFAVDCIRRWWEEYGKEKYPHQTHLLILCDSGGSNGYRRRLWKRQLQTQLADPLGLTIYVCHYPSGASKYNPIERKLFSFISKNWAGEPLTSYEKALGFIKTTTTRQGLKVSAALIEKEYKRGIKVSNEQMDSLRIKHAHVCPKWNYCIQPRKLE